MNTRDRPVVVPLCGGTDSQAFVQNTTYYWTPHYARTTLSTADVLNKSWIAPFPGRIRNLRSRMAVALAANNTFVLTVRKGASAGAQADTTMAITFTPADTTNLLQSLGGIPVAAGDEVRISTVLNGTGGNETNTCGWVVEYERLGD